MRYDLAQDRCTTYHEGVHRWFSEAPFAPRNDWKNEDDGYLVGFVWDDLKKASFVHIFDAADVAHGPLARIRVPQRVPHGFHATWVSGERLMRGF